MSDVSSFLSDLNMFQKALGLLSLAAFARSTLWESKYAFFLRLLESLCSDLANLYIFRASTVLTRLKCLNALIAFFFLSVRTHHQTRFSPISRLQSDYCYHDTFELSYSLPHRIWDRLIILETFRNRY